MSRPRCYIASPLGFNEGGIFYYRERYLPALARVVDPVDPWGALDPDKLDAAREKGALRALWMQIGADNLKMIRGCELLVAWLDGQEVDSGTAVELGYAAACGVRCFGLRSDLRQAGEEGVAVNLQVEAIIDASGGAIAATLEDLLSRVQLAITAKG